ncbi:MAG: hypothetical protein HY447_02395 [Candidatus Omnitrophica bacterium]|nr:hypothetical protein [Candidatus Omnitrophota bacterium]
MKKSMTILVLTFFVLGFAIPTVWAVDTGAWITATKDKTIRGIEDGLFGMGGELYHHIDTRSEESFLEGWTLGLFDGLHQGLKRTLVGAYELATPFYHDEPVLEDLDTVIKG